MRIISFLIPRHKSYSLLRPHQGRTASHCIFKGVSKTSTKDLSFSASVARILHSWSSLVHKGFIVSLLSFWDQADQANSPQDGLTVNQAAEHLVDHMGIWSHQGADWWPQQARLRTFQVQLCGCVLWSQYAITGLCLVKAQVEQVSQNLKAHSFSLDEFTLCNVPQMAKGVRFKNPHSLLSESYKEKQ